MSRWHIKMMMMMDPCVLSASAWLVVSLDDRSLSTRGRSDAQGPDLRGDAQGLARVKLRACVCLRQLRSTPVSWRGYMQ